MKTDRARTAWPRAATALGLLVALVAGCSSNDSGGSGDSSPGSANAASTGAAMPTPPTTEGRSLCQNANDYLWWVTFLGTGAQTPEALELGLAIPKDAARYEYIFTRPRQLSRALVDQVPADQRDAARRAYLTWRGEGEVLDAYDYDPRALPDSVDQQMADKVGKYQPSNTRYLEWLRKRCDTGEGSFPTPPSDARLMR